jgi:hypothetical protein
VPPLVHFSVGQFQIQCQPPWSFIYFQLLERKALHYPHPADSSTFNCSKEKSFTTPTSHLLRYKKTGQCYYSDRKEFNGSMHKLISQEQLSWIHDDGSVAVLANGKLYLPCNYWSLLVAADLCVLKSNQKICHKWLQPVFKWLQPVLASFRLWNSLCKGLTRFTGSISILCLQTSKLTINCFSDVGFRVLGFPQTLENFLTYISCVADLLIRQKLFIWLELWLPAEYKRVGMFAEIGSFR